MDKSEVEEVSHDVTVGSKKDTFLARVKSGDFKAIPLPGGHYFINKAGVVVSMNRESPHQIFPMLRSDGAYIVLLYAPQVKQYDVAELILTTFAVKPKNADYVCFKDNNFSNCEFDNLYWGNEKTYLKMKQRIVEQQTERMLKNASTADSVSLDSILASSNELDCPSNSKMFKLNAELLSDISKMLSELAQLAAKEVISSADNDYLCTVTKALYDVTNQQEVKASVLIDLCLLEPKDDEFASIMERNRHKFTHAGNRYA